MANQPISDIETYYCDGLRSSDFHQDHCHGCERLTDVTNTPTGKHCEPCADELFDADGNEKAADREPMTFPSFALGALTVAAALICVTIFVASVLMENSEVTALKTAIFGANQ